MEDPAVFAATHDFILGLLATGKITGLRIDHPDGLLDPVGYFQQLQHAYVLRQCQELLARQSDYPAEERDSLARTLLARYTAATRSLSANKLCPACQSIVAVGEREGDTTFSCLPSLFHTNTRRPMMSEHSGKPYRPWQPERYQHEAQSPAAKLPEGDVVFFLLDTVRRLDLRRCYAPYEQETRGAPPFAPALLVCLLLSAYCVGVFASRQIALACERNRAFIAIVGQERPDFRTLSAFRTRHLEAFKDVCVQVVRLAGEAGLVRLGHVATDGTKMQGNASRHKALSSGDMKQAVERLREEREL